MNLYRTITIILLIFLLIFIILFIIDIYNFFIHLKPKNIVSKFPVLPKQNTPVTKSIDDFFQKQLKKISIQKIFTGNTTNQINLPNFPPINFSSQFKLPEIDNVSFNSKYVSIVNPNSTWDNIFLSIGKDDFLPLVMTFNVLNNTFLFTSIYIRNMKIDTFTLSNLRLSFPPSAIVKNNEFLIQYDIHLKYSFEFHCELYGYGSLSFAEKDFQIKGMYDTYGLLNLAIIHENLLYEPYNIPSDTVVKLPNNSSYKIENNVIYMSLPIDDRVIQEVALSDSEKIKGTLITINFKEPVCIKKLDFNTEDADLQNDNQIDYVLLDINDDCKYPQIIDISSYKFGKTIQILIKNKSDQLNTIKLDILKQTGNAKYKVGTSTFQIVPNKKSTQSVVNTSLDFSKPFVKFYRYKLNNIFNELINNFNIPELLNTICYDCPNTFETELDMNTIRNKINNELDDKIKNITNSLKTNLTQPVTIFDKFTFTIQPVQIDIGKLFNPNNSIPIPIYIINKQSTLNKSIFSKDIDGKDTNFSIVQADSGFTTVFSKMQMKMDNFELNMDLDNVDLVNHRLNCSLNFNFQFNAHCETTPLSTTFASYLVKKVTFNPFYINVNCNKLPFQLNVNNIISVKQGLIEVFIYACENFSQVSTQQLNRGDSKDIIKIEWPIGIGDGTETRKKIFEQLDPILNNITANIMKKIKSIQNKIIKKKLV